MNCANHPAVTEGVSRCSRCGVPYCPDCLITLQGLQYCARCKTEQLADLKSGVDSTQLQLAGVGRRFAALWVDGMILGFPAGIIVVAVMMPAIIAGGQGAPPAWTNWIGLAFAPLYIIYEGLMLSRRGQTLGKMALKIKVVQAGGGTISQGQAWGRAVVRGVFVSLLSLINYLPAFFTKQKTCIHDMAAKTRVVMAR